MNPNPSISIARNIQRKLATLASTRPIELIVTVFCVVTIAYFQLLHAVTNSNFFEPLNQEINRNHNGIFGHDDWWNFSWGANLQEPNHGLDLAAQQQSNGGEGMVYVLKTDSKQWIPLSQVTFEDNDVSSSYETLFDGSLTYLVDPVLVVNSDSSSVLKDITLPSVASTLKSQLNSATSASFSSMVSSPKMIEVENQSAYSLGVITADADSPSSASRESIFIKLSSFNFLSSVLRESNSSSNSNLRPNNSKKGKDNVGEEKQNQDFRLLPLLPDSHTQRSGATEELRSIRWAAYAIRALVVRFWALVKVS